MPHFPSLALKVTNVYGHNYFPPRGIEHAHAQAVHRTSNRRVRVSWKFYCYCQHFPTFRKYSGSNWYSYLCTSFRLTTHRILIDHDEIAITSLPRPCSRNDGSASNLTLPSWLSHTQGPPTLNNSRSINSSKLRWKLLHSETTLTSSLQSTDLTATIVWARFSYRNLTGLPHVDDRLPFCCKFATQRVTERGTSSLTNSEKQGGVAGDRAGGGAYTKGGVLCTEHAKAEGRGQAMAQFLETAIALYLHSRTACTLRRRDSRWTNQLASPCKIPSRERERERGSGR